MTTAFPAAIDAFPNPTGGMSENTSPTLSERLSNLNDAVHAIEVKVGVNGSADAQSLEVRAGALRGDLADGVTAGKGATLISYGDGGVGSAPRTLDARLRGRLELEVLSFIPSAQWAAIVANTSTFNAGPYIQAANDALAVLGGGTLLFPQGTLRTLQTVVNTHSAITWKGLGNGYQISGQANIRASALSRLEWDPGNTPVAGTAVARFAVPSGSSGVGGGGITDLFIDGQTVCPIGLDIVSWNRGWFNRVTCYACTADQFLLETANYSLVQSAGATQNNRFTDCWASTVGGSGWYLTATANGFRLQGGSSFNTGDASYNVFDNCRADMSLGTGYFLEACGQDTFRNCSYSELSSMATPVFTATPATTGGTIAAGTQSYRVVAWSNYTGEVTSSNVVTCTTTGATSKVTLAWSAVPGRTVWYSIYGRTSGSEVFIASTQATSYVDTGAITPSGAILTARPAYGMVLGSTDQYTGTGTTGVARYHSIFYCEMSIWARASNQVGGAASFGNTIYGMSNGNGNLTPVTLEVPTNNTSFPQVVLHTSGTGGGTVPATVFAGKVDLDGNVSNGGYFVNGTKVVGARVTGWLAHTGASDKTSVFNSGVTYVFSATYTQSELNTIGAALTLTRQRIGALEDALRAHGLIN